MMNAEMINTIKFQPTRPLRGATNAIVLVD